MRESHVSESRKFAGEETAVELVKWLNKASGTHEQARVCLLIELSWRIRDLCGQKPASVIARESFFGMKTELNKTIKLYWKLIKRYRFFPMIQPWSKSPCHWVPVEHGRNKLSDESPLLRYDDYDAVRDLAELADAGWFAKLLRCRCGCWLFARFRHQRFCSAKCREKEYKTTPEWRAHRREKARQYYWLKRHKNVK